MSVIHTRNIPAVEFPTCLNLIHVTFVPSVLAVSKSLMFVVVAPDLSVVVAVIMQLTFVSGLSAKTGFVFAAIVFMKPYFTRASSSVSVFII